MRGKIVLRLLETIGEMAVDQATLWEAILASGYGATSGKIDREVRRIERRRANDNAHWHSLKRRYYNSLSYLKREGLITEERQARQSTLRLTQKGLAKLAALRDRLRINIPERRSYSSAKQPKQLIIVAFDIPERERRKRDWLREVLRNMGLTKIQRSVWLGKTKLSPEFLRDIHELDLDACVEIFGVSQAGTLRRLT